MGGPRINSHLDDDELFARSYNRLHTVKKEKTREQIVKSYWNSMKSRIKKGVYLEKGIKIVWTFQEFCEWFNANWDRFESIKQAGEIPSIDRIDSNSNYSIENCRMIPMSVNSALGEVNLLIGRMKTLQRFLKENEHWLKDEGP